MKNSKKKILILSLLTVLAVGTIITVQGGGGPIPTGAFFMTR
ncbi:hypothetical protein [Clostridium yunnanense]|nr:hypothetical protein [Clostridium yunnanense]